MTTGFEAELEGTIPGNEIAAAINLVQEVSAPIIISELSAPVEVQATITATIIALTTVQGGGRNEEPVIDGS